MARNPWVPVPRMTDDEINAAVENFKQNGGEVIEVNDSFETTRTNSETAVKIGKIHSALDEIKSKK